jgi:hypothetical protein
VGSSWEVFRRWLVDAAWRSAMVTATDFDPEHDAVVAAQAAAAWAGTHGDPWPSREALRARMDQALRAERGEAWMRENQGLLDAQWAEMVALGLV